METPAKQFETILGYSEIQKVYFIDDYLDYEFSVDNLKVLAGEIIAEAGKDKLVEKLHNLIDLSRVPESEIPDLLEKFYENAGSEGKTALKEIIFDLSDNDFIKESKLTSRIVDMFPGNIALGVHPSKWEEVKKQNLNNDTSKGQVLLIFDQDLSNVSGFTKTHGIRLILELKKESYFGKLTCILISNDILETKDELLERQRLLAAMQELTESDFFALSKKRMEVTEHFYDGIKKSLLNSHCELIKNKSSEIIKEAYQKTLIRIKEINTYDFDHTIFQSSYEEGVWEAETLFRIAGVIFDEEIKKEIIAKGFQKKVNGNIRDSKRLSDIRFKINSSIGEPYTEKYKLRHSEIYEAGEIINKLHKPIDNGDIFEIYEGSENTKGLYILIGQECDLMVRNPSGERESKLGYLYKTTIYNPDKFYDIVKLHYEQNRRDFFDSKFKLDYIISGENHIGIVSFKNPIIVDLRILDLVVFNEDGEAMFDLKNPVDTSVLSFAWENRYSKLNEFFKVKSGWAVKAYSALKKLKDSQDVSTVEHLTAINRLKLSAFRSDVGSERTLNKEKYSFGMRRVLNFRNPGSAILLDTYTKYQSRSAPPHDFANLS